MSLLLSIYPIVSMFFLSLNSESSIKNVIFRLASTIEQKRRALVHIPTQQQWFDIYPCLWEIWNPCRRFKDQVEDISEERHFQEAGPYPSGMLTTVLLATDLK
jgi:hypothetical protein